MQAQWMNDGGRGGEGTDDDRARPSRLLFLQFGRLFVAAVGYVEILCAIFRGRAGDPHCRESVRAVIHCQKCTRSAVASEVH